MLHNYSRAVPMAQNIMQSYCSEMLWQRTQARIDKAAARQELGKVRDVLRAYRFLALDADLRTVREVREYLDRVGEFSVTHLPGFVARGIHTKPKRRRRCQPAKRHKNRSRQAWDWGVEEGYNY